MKKINIFPLNRFGVNIKDEHGRTPIHSAFRSSTHKRSNENEFTVEYDFGDKVRIK